MIARHVRSYDRHKDFEDPDHPKALLAQRRKARDQKILMRFLTLTKKADLYYRKLLQRRMNPNHHVRKIVALSEIYDPETITSAIEDAFRLNAFSCEYIANLLEQRTRSLPEPDALHITHRKGLLELEVPNPNIAINEKNERNRND